jgi:uncharacterized protein (DUF2235 family)
MQRIVVCCDGTWNTADQNDRGIPIQTNVTLFHTVVAKTGPDGVEQVAIYHPGVGTDESWTDRVLGGGLGLGLDQNIMSAYRNLCDQYRAGDDIYLIGFSRGAYTVRSLAGFVGRCGLIDTDGLAEAEAWSRIETAFTDGYRKGNDWNSDGWPMRAAPNGEEAVPIRFIGVWDTVGALGIPDHLGVLNILDRINDKTFHDTKLGSNLQTARHAVAIDEKRQSFQPTLWIETEGRDVKQIWFPGVHSDVGGGYLETGLSDGALRWMVDEAAACGLEFQDGLVAQIEPDHRGLLHDSLTGLFESLPSKPRSTAALDDAVNVHESGIKRHQNPPLRQSPYWPTHRIGAGQSRTVGIYAIEPWNATGIWLEAGVTYRMTATGEWKDKSVPCGPGGTNDGKLHLGEVAHLLGSFVGKFEGIFKDVGGNEQADFLTTRRHEEMPWFCLVGAIGNGGGVVAQVHDAHQIFMIGEGATVTPEKSGYLYGYANDAWGFYHNNRGKVSLTVARD